jgi:hypothetical protein
MAGYLDQYGAGDERREKRNRWLVIAAGTVLGVLVIWWFLYGWDKSEIVRESHVARLVQKLRNHSQEDEVRQFLDLVRSRQYEAAYKVWGPNKDYPFDNFMEDWGPQSQRQLGSFDIVRSRTCGSGVVITVDFPKGEQTSLWVQKADKTIGFSPFAGGCPASP